MESKVFWFGTIFLLLVIGIFSYLKIAQAEPEDIAPSNTESCENIAYSGENRIDLLFLSTKEEAQEYSDLFFQTEPFKEYKDYFNIRVIEGTNPICDSYKGIAILCNTKSVQQTAKTCEHDYIIVVKDEPESIRSSSYGNVMSLNKNVEKSVFIHEFGHAFATLAEEYHPAKIPRGAKNCQSSCGQFGELADSCSKECSQSDLYRSIKSGVMRTLSTADFGTYNIQILKKLLEKNRPSDSVLTGNQIQEDSSCNNPLVQVELIQTEDSVSVKSTNEITLGCYPDNSGAGETRIGDLYYTLDSIFTDTQESDAETLSGELLPAQDTTILLIPADGQQVQITQNGELVGVVDTIKAGATACLT